MAQWLDTVCFAFDRGILEAIHSFAVTTDHAFLWFLRLISLLGEEGIGLIIMGLLLLLFRPSRRTGICVLLGLLCGLFITNIFLKNAVARVRPFQREDVEAFRAWWEYAGATTVSEKSFPSGHTTAAMSAMTALFLHGNKKYSWTAYIFVVLTGLSRMYLVVHYPTDILGGLLAGGLAAAAAYGLTVWIYRQIAKHPNAPVSRFVLHFDLVERIRGKKTVVPRTTDTGPGDDAM